MLPLSRRARALPAVGAATLLLSLLRAGPAGAEPLPDDRALATALFNEGRGMMLGGRTAEACPKLEESHRLDPSGGTILNLALCHEQQGLLARSWSEFHEAGSFARRDGRSDREQAAESHVRALEPRLSKLTIVVAAGVRVDGLRIERDGRELGQASWSTAMPVDGGEHVVRASAPGKVPFVATIVVDNESDARIVEIPLLAAVVAALPVATAAPPRDDGARRVATQRTIAWTLGAAGLVEWGAAAYFGVRAFKKHADSNSACPDDHCSPLGVELNDASRRAADASTVLAMTGLATVAASALLLLTTPKASEVALPTRPKSRWVLGSTGSTIVVQHHF